MKTDTIIKTIRMPVELIRRVEELAKANNRSFSNCCVKVLTDALSNEYVPEKEDK